MVGRQTGNRRAGWNRAARPRIAAEPGGGGLFQRAAELSPYWQEAVHSLKGLPNVIDIRNIGLVGGIELAPREGAAGKRGMEACIKAYEAGLMVRVTGDIIALSPPLIVEKGQIDQMVEITGKVIEALD